MNNFPRYTILGALVIGLFSACASPPEATDRQIELRNKLAALQNDPVLSRYSPQARTEAESAVARMNQPQASLQDRTHNEFIAYHKIEIAEVKAREAYLLERQNAMSDETAAARLASRTAEADDANRRAAALKTELAAMNAKPSPRGMLVTLGDVLFSTGQSTLSPNADVNLDKLLNFLNNNPESRLAIEGHTDSVGAGEANLALSQSRAFAVSSYLEGKGVSRKRMSVQGMGENAPVASNDSAAGRQLNRRVEATILD